MKAVLPLIATLALAGSGLPLRAQAPAALPDNFLPYDVDQDGKLSREEWQAWLDDNQPGKQKNVWDTNLDGKLSPQEIATGRELIRRRLELKFRERFREADVDEDGRLSLEEFSGTVPKEVAAARIRKAFELLDVDGDGFISVEEFLASGGVGPLRRPPSASLIPKTAPSAAPELPPLATPTPPPP